MNRKEKIELARWSVEFAKKSGADEAAVDLYQSRDIETEFREGKLDQLKESTQSSLSLTLYVNNRYSNHSTNDIRKESLKQFIAEAVSMTGYLSEDLFRSLPDPKYYEGRKEIDLKINDSNYEKVTSEQRVDIAREIEAIAAKQSDKIISCSAGYSDSHGESVKVHSNGFEGERESTSFSAGVEVTVEDGQSGRPADWCWATVRFFDELPSAEFLARGAAERALGKIGQSKMESGQFDMIVENRSVRRLLYSLFGPMRASSLQQKNSFLEGKLGEKIASEKLTVIDDPFIIKGLGSRTFDGEGLALKRRALIEKGVLKTYLVDTYYGKKLGMEPNSGSTGNVIMEYGDKSKDELIAAMEKGILVTSFIGGNSNSTTGDFSYGIIGKYVENGKIVKPVNEMNISGNLVDLMNQLEHVGNDPYMYSSFRLPSLYFKDVQFSGI
ncbi:MAG: TldD/PmbA family protein [candidate division Zixibacteria bacterium]